MKIAQRMILVSKDDYSELAAEIQNWIDNLESLYTVQQIDYFSMSDNEIGSPTAFILFKPRIK